MPLSNIELDYSYSDILTFHIMRRDGNYQLPRDVQFVESIKTRDAYHMLKPFQISSLKGWRILCMVNTMT